MPSGEVSGYVNTTQVAKALGVSVSTVKRWVDDGVLPAQKTAGGHRKLLLADVIELARRAQLPQADLSFLTGDKPRGRRSPANIGAIAEPLFTALRTGDVHKVRMVMHGAFRRGVSICQLADAAIGPAMERIGREWERGRLDVMEEHRASEICASALYELKAQLESRAPQERPRALGGAPAGDYSVLPSLLAQLALIEAGWEAVNLGPNTPFESLARAVDTMRPRLLWLSVCHLEDETRFVTGYRKLYAHAEAAGIAVAVGGRALTEAVRAKIPYTAFGDHLAHLDAFARTLHARPKPPRRGRPPQ